jgi:hypothetical protein
LGEKLRHTRLPFDWVISPITSTTKWLDVEDKFPKTPDDLVPVEGQSSALFWRERGVYFWHDFQGANDIDLEGTFDEYKNRYEYSFEKFDQQRHKIRITLLISNTQNNIPAVIGPAYHILGFSFNAENVRYIKKATERCLGRECDMLCVTYDARSEHDLGNIPEENITVVRVPNDRSDWKGDDTTWEGVLNNYFSP